MKKREKSDPAVSYDDFKEFEGRKYTGMKVGRSHEWYYDQGVWKETKVTPDLWQISYAVSKRRAGKAPEGSGVPVDTEYHWYVLAHQNVRKINANDYTTSLTGLKFKVAHKRADSGKWSASPAAQRRRMIKFLQSVIADLEKEVDETAVKAEAGLKAEAAVSAKKASERAGMVDERKPRARAKASSRKPASPPSMSKPSRRRPYPVR